MLFCLDRQNPIRKFSIALTENPKFDAFVMVLIILNTLWMLVLPPPRRTVRPARPPPLPLPRPRPHTTSSPPPLLDRPWRASHELSPPFCALCCSL